MRGTSNTILSSFVDQYHLQISGDDLVFKKCRAYVLALCCLASPAKAAGIELFNSDPGLLGAIWYPCTAEPEDVPLGDLAASPEIRLTGVKDCPVRGEKLPLVIFSRGRGGWCTMHHDTERRWPMPASSSQPLIIQAITAKTRFLVSFSERQPLARL